MGEGGPQRQERKAHAMPALCNAHMLDAFLFETANLFTELGAAVPSDGSNAPPEPAQSASADHGASVARSPLSPSLHPQPDTVRKLENMGFYVGRRLVERHTRNRNLNLDNNHAVMKYLCKEFWQLAFMNAASKLRTNHRGIFVFDDDRFRWLSAVGPVE